MGWLDNLSEGAGAALGGLFGFGSGVATNVASAYQAEKQMKFQERMSNTQHQRQIADLKKAGLNPILSVTGASKGAGSPMGAMAQMKDPVASAVSLQLLEAQARKAIADAKIAEGDVPLAELKGDVTEEVRNIYGSLEDRYKNWDWFPALNNSTAKELQIQNRFKNQGVHSKQHLKESSIRGSEKYFSHHPVNKSKKSKKSKIKVIKSKHPRNRR